MANKLASVVESGVSLPFVTAFYCKVPESRLDFQTSIVIVRSLTRSFKKVASSIIFVAKMDRVVQLEQIPTV